MVSNITVVYVCVCACAYVCVCVCVCVFVCVCERACMDVRTRRSWPVTNILVGCVMNAIWYVIIFHVSNADISLSSCSPFHVLFTFHDVGQMHEWLIYPVCHVDTINYIDTAIRQTHIKHMHNYDMITACHRSTKWEYRKSILSVG